MINMSINYPASLDNFPDPTILNNQSNPNHPQLHSDINAAVEALQVKVGINSSADTNSLDYKINHGAGSGDVTGPAISGDNNVVFFDGTSGKIIKDNGITLSGTNTGDQDLSGYVPTSRTVNSKALTSNISLTASDVGAPSGSGTSTGTNTGDQTNITGNAGTVTNATLTTAITIDTGTVTIHGNIANTSVLTLGAGASSVSGSNTGDQTNITGNAGTVTNATLTTALTIDTGTVTIHGDIANTSALTLGAGASSVSGSNTGDQDLSGLVTKSTYDANTILYATTDNTPVALTVGEQTVVGRATGGAISALAIDSDLSSVSANDDTVPSAKATKAALDLKLALSGGTLTGAVNLGENAGLEYDAALSADGKYSGLVRSGTAGAALAFGDLCYLAAADSRWELVDANAASTSGDVLLGMCVLAANADGDATKMLLCGFIRADAAFPALTISAPAYASTTAGDIQTTQPSGTDDVIRRVGFAWTADELYFNPSNDYVTHT